MKLLLSLAFCISFFTVLAQSNSYLEDLAALKAIVQKTPSFRDQVKGEKLNAYNETYARLAADTVSDPRNFEYFYNLSQLLFPLRDNHIGFYQLPAQDNDYPKYDINIDSLKKVLSEKPADSIEGIY